MVAKLKKRQAKPNLNDSRSRALSVGPNMSNDYSFTAWSHWQRILVAKLKKDRLNLTLMTRDREPCQLVPIWLMPLHLEHGHTSSVFMAAKLKKRQAKPNPYDSRSRTLSVGPNMANDSSFRAWSH